ncbi:hypothetical protein ApAK_07290 [Thermoplasmatales archaeon AK]|nr:hypothetical protein [Thermoplasmatales archaeon AK]
MIVNGVHYNKMDFFLIADDGKIFCRLCSKEVRTPKGRRTHLTACHPEYFGISKERMKWISISVFNRKQREERARAMAEWYNSSGWNRTEVRR